MKCLAVLLILALGIDCKGSRGNPAPVGPSAFVANQDNSPVGITMKGLTTITQNGRKPEVVEHVYYRKGTLRRKDTLSSKGTPSVIVIENCDSMRGVMLDPNVREYRTYKVPARFWSDGKIAEYSKQNPIASVQVRSQTVDTGERRVAFGQIAKHLTTTIHVPRSANGYGGEETIDGWYIDRDRPDDACIPPSAAMQIWYVLATVLVTYPEVAQFHHTGPTPTGLPVESIRVVRFAGTEPGTWARTVIDERKIEDLSDSPLDAPMFEVPSGFNENPHLFQAPKP